MLVHDIFFISAKCMVVAKLSRPASPIMTRHFIYDKSNGYNGFLYSFFWLFTTLHSSFAVGTECKFLLHEEPVHGCYSLGFWVSCVP